MNKVQLYNDDCLNTLPKLIQEGVKVDMILTDIPYEFDLNGGCTGKMAKRAKKVKDSIRDMSNGIDYDTVFNYFMQICNIPNFLIFCSNKQISKIMGWFEDKGLAVTLLVWHKTNAIPCCNLTYISDLEFIVYVRGKGAYWNNDLPMAMKSKIFTSPMTSPINRQHPAQKRIEHLDRYIQLHSKENDTILDAFMGSGTTGISAVKNKRNFIGIEIDKKYFDIAEFNINAENKQTQLF
jgi:site-specific DNA-methyltransferase (adenine-specific)